MLGQGCGKTVLARGPCAEVTRCTCGHLHLAMGPVALRLEEDVLRAIGVTLVEAIQQLGTPEAAHAHSSGRWNQ